MQQNPSKQKVALITGAARRIGAEIARQLHAEGFNLVLHYNASEQAARDLSEQLNHIRPHSAVALRAELGTEESSLDLINQVEKNWGRLDVVVNNASRFYRTLIGKITSNAWNDLLDSNLKAPFFLSQAAVPLLSANKGVIINITDVHAERPMRDYSVYCISKAGLTMLTKAMARELAPNIRVNAVAPGSILWPEGENSLSDDDKQKIISRTPLGRGGMATDIAKAVLFFVRDADYITGQILSVDGGRSLSLN